MASLNQFNWDAGRAGFDGTMECVSKHAEWHKATAEKERAFSQERPSP